VPRHSPGHVRKAPGWTKGLDGSAERHGVARTVARTVTVGLAALLGIAPAAGAVTVGDSGGTTYQGAQGGPSASSGTSPAAVTPAPSSSVKPHSGGARTGPALGDKRPPVITQLTVSRGPARRGSPLRVRYLIRDRSPRVRVTLSFVRPGHGTVFRARRGWQRTGSSHSYSISPASERTLVPDGSYEIRVSARDPGGNRLVRRTTVERPLEQAAPPAAVNGVHRFPVAGPYSFGGPDARFGAARTGHVHQGQDVMAAEGTPVVAPAAGVISYRAYQASGAGYYVVLDADGEQYDYVFMHLQSGVLVTKGQRVTAGQQIGNVGHTGDAEGPHLHFEVWDGPWFNGGHAIDPLPFLRAWAT